MSSVGPEGNDELENVELGVMTTSVGGSAGNVEEVSTNLSTGERQAIVGILSQHLGTEDKRGVSVGGQLKDEMVGANGHLETVRNFVEKREEADEEEEQELLSEFRESSRQIATDLHSRVQNLPSDINESQIYIVSAKLDAVVEGEDRYVGAVLKMKTYDAMGIDRNEDEEDEESTDEDTNDASFVPEIDQLDKILIYPHVAGNDTCLFAPFGSDENDQGEEGTPEEIVKFYQSGNRSKYFEDFVANEIRPNSKEQLKKSFDALDSIKESGDLTPSEFDQLFNEGDCITEENLVSAATDFSNIDDEDEAKTKLKEELSRPNLSSLSAQASTEKKPGKMKHTFKGRNSGEQVSVKYKSSAEDEVEILPNEETDKIIIKVNGEMDEVEIVDN